MKEVLSGCAVRAAQQMEKLAGHFVAAPVLASVPKPRPLTPVEADIMEKFVAKYPLSFRGYLVEDWDVAPECVDDVTHTILAKLAAITAQALRVDL